MKTFRHQRRVDSLAYSPDGATLFSADAAGILRAWNPVTGEHGVVLQSDVLMRYNLTVSPDGRWLLIDEALCRIGPIPERNDSVVLDDYGGLDPPFLLADGWAATALQEGYGCSFSPDSRLVAGEAGGGNQRIRLWKTANGRPVGDLRHEHLLGSPTFSPNGKTLVTVFSDGSTDTGLALWDVKTRTLRQAERVHYDEIEFGSIPLYSPDGRCLAVASGDKIHLHTVRPRMLAWTGTLRSNTRKTILTMAFSPNGKRLLTGGKDKIVRLWDVNAKQPLAEWDWKIGEINKVAFAPDGMTAAVAGTSRQLVVWDLDV